MRCHRVFAPTGGSPRATAPPVRRGCRRRGDVRELRTRPRPHPAGPDRGHRRLGRNSRNRRPVPVTATRTVLTRAGLPLADIDTFAGNEPFAAQILAYCTEPGLDPERMNPHGGSIALGEPYGAAGARLTTTDHH
ncbi:hypothetical protein [Streptomyces sp. NBC_01207]|uniref:hypothetical protein n=1 Tax=Streptomyces sp. NBC_01207 TaxID=2903772 RepID=UPI002E134EDB|nr:hypothetical protein OG457_06065 [Streptomyces sp. NBC_01207]